MFNYIDLKVYLPCQMMLRFIDLCSVFRLFCSFFVLSLSLLCQILHIIALGECTLSNVTFNCSNSDQFTLPNVTFHCSWMSSLCQMFDLIALM